MTIAGEGTPSPVQILGPLNYSVRFFCKFFFRKWVENCNKLETYLSNDQFIVRTCFCNPLALVIHLQFPICTPKVSVAMPVSAVGSLETKVFDDLKSSHIALNALTSTKISVAVYVNLLARLVKLVTAENPIRTNVASKVGNTEIFWKQFCSWRK